MPVQFLYPTGVISNGQNWLNQAGQKVSVVGSVDVDEGYSSPDGNYNVSNYLSDTHSITYFTGPILVNPESIIFRTRLQASGSMTDSQYNVTLTLSDNRNTTIVTSTVLTFENINGSFRNVVYSTAPNVLFDVGNADLSNSRLNVIFNGTNFASTSGELIDNIEVELSGSYLRWQSGIPLYLRGASNKNIVLSPEGLKSRENRWFGTYNYTGIFDVAYCRLEEGSGNIVRSENSNVSGIYTVSTTGFESGMLWHNKRLTRANETTYGLAPKFNSVNNSALLFNSGLLYNKSQFCLFARYFPSGNSFDVNGHGPSTILSNATQLSGSFDFNFKVETSGYTNFYLTTTSPSNGTQTSTFVVNDNIYGFDLCVSYNNPVFNFYTQSHNSGIIGSGSVNAGTLYHKHNYRVGIGGVIP